MSDNEIDELRELILSHKKKKGSKYSEAVRSRLIPYLKREMEAGVLPRELIARLGISKSVLYAWKKNWSGQSPSSRQLRRVKIVTNNNSRQELTLLGPAGTRIEGVTIADVVAIWRNLS